MAVAELKFTFSDLPSADEMVEKAAIALFNLDYPNDDWSRFGPNDFAPTKYRKKALAALNAAFGDA